MLIPYFLHNNPCGFCVPTIIHRNKLVNVHLTVQPQVCLIDCEKLALLIS